jgi:outer membrane protein OmpA-like peptidoglycan-associated protein
MRNTISTLAVLGLVALAPALAQANSSKEEAIGVGTGGVIGAVVGGPVGFIIGAAIGARIGDTLHQKDEQIDVLSGSLQDSHSTIDGLEQSVYALNTDLDSLGSEFDRMQRISRPEVVSLLQAGIAMDLLFRTDEYVLANTTDGRLSDLAVTLASMPGIQVQLDGFADERGSAAYNQKLSRKRVEFVRKQLIAGGVHPSRIGFAAHGESKAVDNAIDSFALERRVSMTLFIDDAPAFASNPD